MRKAEIKIGIVLILVILLAPALHALNLTTSQKTSFYTMDVSANQQAPTTVLSGGTGTDLEVRAGSGSVRRAYMGININNLTATQITSAKLFIYTTYYGLDVKAYWCEGLTWGETALTWNNQPAGTTLDTIGGSCNSTLIGSYTPVLNTYLAVDIKEELNGVLLSSKNMTLIFIATSEVGAGESHFYTKESGTNPPYLQVGYDYNPSSGTVLFTYPIGMTFYNDYTGKVQVNTTQNTTTCWINNSIWSLEGSSPTNYTFINNTSIPDGQYTLNVNCTQTSDGLNISNEITFTTDTTKPTIQTDLINNTVKSLYYNFTVNSTDTNLLNVSIQSSCNIHYANASLSSPHSVSFSQYLGNCSVGSQTTTLTAFDQAGNSQTYIYSWDSRATLRIYAFDPSVAAIQNFTIFLNGSSQGATLNGVLDVTNLNLTSYNVSIDASGYGLANATVPVTLGFQTYNFSLFVTNSIYFTFRDESTLGLLTGHTINVQLISDVFGSNYTTTNSTLYLDLLSPTLYTIRYDSINYTQRFYYFNLLNRTSTNLTLYLSDNSTTQQVTAQVIDNTGSNVEGAYIKVLKYDTTTNSYNTVEIAETNFEGQTILNLLLSNEFYKFIIEYPLGTVKLSTNPTYVYGTTLNFQINLAGSLGEDFFTTQDITHSLTFNNATSNFKFIYSDASNTISQGCLYVYKMTTSNDILLNSSCASSPASTILVGITQENGTTYKAQGYIKFSGEPEQLLQELIYSLDTDQISNSFSTFWVLLLCIVFAFMALYDRSVALVITPLPMIVASYLKFWLVPLSISITISIIMVILAVALSNKNK